MSEIDAFYEAFRNSIFGRTNPNVGWDWQVEQPEWMLDKLIPGGSIGMIYGPSNSGKSHLICDLVTTILKGQKYWQGIELKTGPVVMFSESQGHIKARLKAYADESTGQIEHDIYMLPTVSMEFEDMNLFTTWLESLPIPPMVIIFDTLATAFSFEENDNREASRLIKFLESEILTRMHPDGTIVIVHHTSKGSEGRSARGASALIANIDWSIRVEWDKNIERTIAVWEKDRWRLVDKTPRWAGDMHRVNVEFVNGEAEMAVLSWEPYSLEAQEMQEALAEEGKVGMLKDELSKLLAEHGRDAFFPSSQSYPADFESYKFVLPGSLRPHGKLLKEWLIDTHDTEPVYSARGRECGFVVRYRKPGFGDL